MTRTNSRRRGVASLMVLVVLTVISIILASILQHNATQRTSLKSRQQSTEAFLLADSGVAEALHRLAANPSAGTLTRNVGKGSYQVSWQPAKDAAGAWDILSTGLSRTADPTSPKRTVQARAGVDKGGVRVMTWKTGGGAAARHDGFERK